jgi:hypothetical protein
MWEESGNLVYGHDNNEPSMEHILHGEGEDSKGLCHVP